MTLSLWRGAVGLALTTLLAVGACAQADDNEPDQGVLDPQGQGGAGTGDAGGSDAGDGGDGGAAGGTAGAGGAGKGGGGAAGSAGAKAGSSGSAGTTGGTSAGAGGAGAGGAGAGGAGGGGAGTGGGGAAGDGSGGSGQSGTGGAPPKTMDPSLKLPPQSAQGCKNEGQTGGDCNSQFLVCRIYNQSEGRCEGCSGCAAPGTACTASVQCGLTAQCHGGFCRELCQLETKLCKNGGKCQDVGNESAGVCVP